MLSRFISRTLFCLVLAGTGLAHAGLTSDTSYTERGKADFDTFLQLLNPYGTWAKIDGSWAYTPTDHATPYTDGRWIYTEYGWFWKGNAPHSWATEHYGYWKRGADHVWSWYPLPYWLPQTVEIRGTPGYIGWRSAEVDDDGNFVEAPADRYTKTDEWTFVTLAQFTGPITPAIVAKPDVAEEQLEDSTDSVHTYVTYREIDRPGPHPADFLPLIKDSRAGGMFAPAALQDQAQVVQPPVVVPGLVPTTNAPSATNAAAGPNGGMSDSGDDEPAVKARPVKYWITMSLPSYWSKPPADAEAGQIYLYRPEIYQDEDGIARRIELWFHPGLKGSLKDLVQSKRARNPSPDAPAPATAAIPAYPAAAPDTSETHNAFRSPFDDSFKSNSSSRAQNSATIPAPSGAVTNGAAPIPPPIHTSAPAGP